ncbi:hypothetical protein [Fibrobacter sp.]|uniref:hypothetical protein n=1 Tax=Fibrobacter sp. TaxID=35828 RepID=UPI00388EA4FE
MTLAEFNALLEKYNVKPQAEPTEDLPVVKLGIDSFDILMIIGDLEESTGKSLNLSLDCTIGDLLAKLD